MFWLAGSSGIVSADFRPRGPRGPSMLFAATADRSVRRVLVHDFAQPMRERRHGVNEEDVLVLYKYYYNDY